jgi:hypothetical protein
MRTRLEIAPESMTRVVLAHLPLPAKQRLARSCLQRRRKHHNPFSRYPRVQPKPRLGANGVANLICVSLYSFLKPAYIVRAYGTSCRKSGHYRSTVNQI